MAVFVRDAAGIRHVLKDLDGPVGQHIYKLSRRTASEAKRQVGVDSGDLKASIGFTVGHKGGHIVGTIGSSNKIALMHHEGTRPHIIRPKKGQALRFGNRGKIVYTKVVHHPGTKPNKYLTDSLARVVK